MSGTILLRPVEANITHDTNWLGKMDPYCKFSIGANHAKSSICKHGGTRPHWGDTVSLQTTGLTSGVANVIRVELFDKDKFRPDDHIAYTDIDLAELEQRGSMSKWYPLYHHKKPAGEILIESAIQQAQQQMYVQNVVPTTTTYVQETYVNSNPVNQVVGESYVVSETVVSGGAPLQTGYSQNVSYGNTANLGSYTTVDPNLYNANNLVTGSNIGANPGVATTNPLLASKTSLLGPSGGFAHGHHTLKGQTNAGYSERPGYTLGDTESNPTCQSNLDTTGGGFFNKPGRERRAEPYSLSHQGTYGIPHGQTIDTAGHLRPDVTLNRQAPIGTINHPGITGYVDGYNVPQQQLQGQAGSYTSGLSTGVPGSYTTGLNTGLNQQGLGSYSTGLGTNVSQPSFGQGAYSLGQQDLAQGNLISSLGGQNVGQYGQQGLTQQGLGQYGQQGLTQQGLGQVGQQGLTQQGLGQLGQQGLNQQGSVNAGYQGGNI